MKGDGFKIQDNSRIAIIGGGPSGTACAIKLLKEAHWSGKKISVIIFEPKDFNIHYNQCVGVLSPPIVEIFEQNLKMPFPSELIKREIRGYAIHTDGGDSLFLSQSEGTYATRRILFDKFMLEKARELGAEVINSRVTGIEFYNGEEVRIYSEGRFLKVDAVVGAFGLDEGACEVVESASRRTFMYRRPERALDTIITKFHPDPGVIEEKVGSLIHAFLLRDFKKIEFGAITPKGDHIIINIAGRNVSSIEMDRFLSRPEVRSVIGEFISSDADYFRGRYPIKPAKGIIGDRFVAVGDATGWIRPYKGKGVNVALLTGTKAAEVMIRYGISRSALLNYVDAFKEFERDYIYGKLFRFLLLLSLRTGFIHRIISMRKMHDELKEAIYMAVSGEGSYYEIIRRIFTLRSLKSLFFALLRI